MHKKAVIVSIVLCLLFVALASSVNTTLACTQPCRPSCRPPAIPDTDFTEHENAGGVTRILVPDHLPEIILMADHSDSCAFGSADRIQISVSANLTGVGGPFRSVAAYEDNPTRNAFSVGLGTPIIQNLVKRWQIQIFRIGKTVFVYWTIPLVAPKTANTPEVVLPPGMLVFRGKGEPYYMETSATFPSGWTVKYETWKRYDADAYFYCRGWDFSGNLTEAPSPFLIADRTVTWTAP